MESDCTNIMNKSHIHVTLIGSQFNEECEYNNFEFLHQNDMS